MRYVFENVVTLLYSLYLVTLSSYYTLSSYHTLSYYHTLSSYISNIKNQNQQVRRSMKRSCLIGLDFQEFLAAIVKIAEVVHDGTYKSRDTSWEEEDEEKRMMEASDSMDRKLCCLFFHMWNTLNDKHNELQKGKFTKPFQVDEYVVFESSRIIPLSHVLSQECQLYHKKKSLENQRSNTNSDYDENLTRAPRSNTYRYARTTARSFMKQFLNDYNKGMYACLFGGGSRRSSSSSSSSNKKSTAFSAAFEFSPASTKRNFMTRKQRRKSHVRKQIDVDDLYVMM